MNDQEIKETLERMKEVEVDIKRLDKKFEEVFVPKGVYGCGGYHKEFDDEFRPFQDEHNTLTFRLLKEILNRNFGQDFDALYVAAGTDTKTGLVLGGRWTYMDWHYDHLNETKNVPSKPVVEAGFTPLTRSFYDVNLPPEIKPSSFDVTLIKNSGYTYGNRARWVDGIYNHAVEPLKQGGILISGFHMEFVLNSSNSSKDEIKAVEKHFQKVERMKNLFGVTGLDLITTFSYQMFIGQTRVWDDEYALYRKK